MLFYSEWDFRADAREIEKPRGCAQDDRINKGSNSQKTSDLHLEPRR